MNLPADGAGDGKRQLQQTLHKLRDSNIQAIAALVENINTLPLLWRSGATLAQGNCLAEPTRESHLPIPPRNAYQSSLN